MSKELSKSQIDKLGDCLKRGNITEADLRLQHLWAELSEKLSDVVDPAIKYSGGNVNIQVAPTIASFMVANEELSEAQLARLNELSSKGDLVEEIARHIKTLQNRQSLQWQQTLKELRGSIALVEKRGGKE